jgi:small subunit ribosomal protein S18
LENAMQDRALSAERRGGDYEGRSPRSGEPPNITIRRPFFRRRKTSPFATKDAPKIDYKDVKLLQRFVSERGKIVPRRITAVTAKEQRELAQAIKRARLLALLPFVVR